MSDSSNVCPICGEGPLRVQVDKNVAEYKEHTGELDLHFFVCDACGSEQTDATQLRANKRAMMAFKKRVDGLLSGAEVRALRRQLKLSQAEAAKVFGGGPVAFSKYESDDVAQSEAMDRLLRLVAAVPDALHYLQRQAGLGGDEAVQWTTTRMVLAQEERHTLKVIASSSPEPEQVWRKCA
ncbi:MAG TPA: type II toxin-antitoxin system MqsA family antitoxin [Candidatus Binatia bacterium]|nr:type II toxin-antitoxin system MqsA family antitoxin [Candidatus Binatia bacterium]